MLYNQLIRYFDLHTKMEKHVREIFPDAPDKLSFEVQRQQGHNHVIHSIVVRSTQPGAFWSVRIPYEFFQQTNKKLRKVWVQEKIHTVEMHPL